MCGICGMLSLKGQRPDEKVLARMVATLEHRGPDDSGYEVSGPCGLGNTRLAVIDVSEAGHQPMHAIHTPSGDYRDVSSEAWIAYNGEVYNFGEVRAVLRAMHHTFFSETDTETLLRSYLQFGADNFIKPFRGMFALAIWDVTRQKLVLMRDRLGQKPLYYVLNDEWLVFASEIKALLVHPAVSPRPNYVAIPHYLAYGYPPAPDTLFDGIQVLPPGHMLVVDRETSPQVRLTSYWTPPYPVSGPDPRSEDNVIADLLMHLRWAVRIRMISDVPLGAFLSGGLDSAAIVALMAQESAHAIKTFTIGFVNEPSFDETRFARQIAAHYVTEHREFIVEPDVLNLVDELVWFHDQPFGDSSAIPTYLVSKLAREYVTVALTGDGGDELFAGYDRFRAARLAGAYDRLPGVAHRAIGDTVAHLPESTAYRGIVRRANRFVQTAQMPLSLRYLSWVCYTPAAWVRALLGEAQEQAVQQHYSTFFTASEDGHSPDVVAQLLDVNLRTYLPNDLLVKVDRCSMAVSLEARSPFLDHHLVQFAAEIPVHLKLRRGISKYILKQALRGLLPNAVINRKKHGFGVPVGAWFRNELADYARSTLLDDRAKRRGIFDMGVVRQMLDTHTTGQRDLGHALWTLLTFELWMRRYFD
jgi:asparagine synthase (glutamine-hydrolysing)